MQSMAMQHNLRRARARCAIQTTRPFGPPELGPLVKRIRSRADDTCVSDVQHSLSRRTAEAPAPGAALSLRLECCTTDLPTRVLEVEGTRVCVTAPVHLCRRQEIGMRVTAVWDCKTGAARAGATIESQPRRPNAWVLRLDAMIEALDIEERLSDDSAGVIEVGSTTLPARIIDRSYHGVGCLVPAIVTLQPGQRARIVVGEHKRKGTIARVRRIGNQLRVGVQLDDM
jgi:hypothetical protein